MAKVISRMACIFSVAGVEIIPGKNELSNDDFKKLSATDEYKFLVKDNKLEVDKTASKEDSKEVGAI